MPSYADETQKRAAPRMIFNRAVIVHGLRLLKRVLHNKYGSEFDARLDELLGVKADMTGDESKIIAAHAMSEISKVISRIALLTRQNDPAYEMLPSRDYIVGDGWVEFRVEHAYDQYRKYCAMIRDTPLFDSLEVFSHALNSYTPCVDRLCVASDLRRDDSTERIVRLDLRRLAKEGVQSFRS